LEGYFQGIVYGKVMRQEMIAFGNHMDIEIRKNLQIRAA